VATSDTLPAVEAMRGAVTAARNDEILEIAMFLHDEMVDRCENAVEIAIEADDRDAMNEAAVLVARVDDVIPGWIGNKNRRSSETHHRWYRAQEEILEAINDSRAGSRGPAHKTRSKKTASSKPEVALAPFTDDELVEAVATACSWYTDQKTWHGVWSGCVAGALAGSSSRLDHVRVAHGDVIRVGQRLGKLMREGRITLVSKPYESRRYVAETV
jgi:hypothetical protein